MENWIKFCYISHCKNQEPFGNYLIKEYNRDIDTASQIAFYSDVLYEIYPKYDMHSLRRLLNTINKYQNYRRFKNE